jgi:hypothetical protein
MICSCRKPSFAIMNPVIMAESYRAAAERYRAYHGRLVCFHCGGVWSGHGAWPEYDCVTGGTVAMRLAELGAAANPDADEPITVEPLS